MAVTAEGGNFLPHTREARGAWGKAHHLAVCSRGRGTVVPVGMAPAVLYEVVVMIAASMRGGVEGMIMATVAAWTTIEDPIRWVTVIGIGIGIVVGIGIGIGIETGTGTATVMAVAVTATIATGRMTCHHPACTHPVRVNIRLRIPAEEEALAAA